MIHSTVVIDESRGRVRLHDGVTVGAFSVLVGPLVIHASATLSPGCIVGCDAESYTGTSDYTGPIVIGEGAILREKVVVQRGLHAETQTSVGAGCYVMHGCHVAHDVVMEAGVTMAPGVILGGHTRVMTRANMGIGSMTHQFTTVGSLAMVGMGAVVTRDVPPAAKVVGCPARVIGRNTVGIERAGWTSERVTEECHRWESIAMPRARGRMRP